MDAAESRQLLRFGPFELDPVNEELRRSGLIVRLPRQPLRILLLLVRRTGQVVSRDEIHAAIWGNETYVDFEHGINSAIRQIRFALGDHAESPRYVRTLPRRGYSFIGRVEHVARNHAAPLESVPEAAIPLPLPPPPPQRTRAARIVAIAAATILATVVMVALIAQSRRPAVETRSSGSAVAVQPFRRLGPAIPGVDERSFTEELRARIGTLPHAHVSLIEPTASTRADVVIDGTVRQAEDGIRVIVSATDAASQTQIWSETFHRPARRKEGMAVEVAHRVMCEIGRRFLPPPRREPLLRTGASQSAVALYKRARMLHSRSQAYDWMRTKELYEAAVREEPRFAEAWSGLGDVWVGQMLSGPKGERVHAAKRAADCARRAVALLPGNAEAHSTLGLIAAQHDYDLAAAEDALRRATAADPGYVDARANLAMVLTMRGQADESLREFAVAQQLDPVTLDLSPIEPLLYLHARRYEDARARYREILAVSPESGPAIWGLMYTYIAQKNWSEALALLAMLRGEPLKDVPATESGFLKEYRGLDGFMDHGRKQGRFNDYFLALYHAQLGDRDRAYELLDRAIEAHIPGVSYIMVDPRIDNLRGERRFNEVLARLKLGQPPERVAASGR